MLIIDQLSVDELKKIITETIKESLPKAEPQQIKEKHLTRQETAKELRISLVTLNEYSKKGILQSYQVGGRVLYKQSEVEAALKSVKNLKYRRDK